MASPYTPGTPYTPGEDFDTDLLPSSSHDGDDSQNEAEEDRTLLIDEDVGLDEEEEEDGEDLYPDNFMEQCVSTLLQLGFVHETWE